MLNYKKIKIGKNYIETLGMKLGNKNLIVLRGKKGYIMCGYLSLKAADKFKDVAIKITGVSDIKAALNASVSTCSSRAKRLGIYKGQSVKEALKIIV